MDHAVHCTQLYFFLLHIISFYFILFLFIPSASSSLSLPATCRMTAYDRQYFVCDPKIVDWRKYYIVFALGARVYLVRDSLENYDAARVRMKWMKLTHYVIKYLCLVLSLSIFYFLLL